jgi:hypothetical protein
MPKSPPVNRRRDPSVEASGRFLSRRHRPRLSGPVSLFSRFPLELKSEYNRGVDVLIIPEAGREIETLRAFRPRPGTWGVIIGHRRGSRFIVEKIVAAGNPGTVPDERILGKLGEIWPGRIVGIAAVRPGATFKTALLGPAWYGKLVLQMAGPANAPVIRASLVEFKRNFFLDPIPLAPAGKEKADE